MNGVQLQRLSVGGQCRHQPALCVEDRPLQIRRLRPLRRQGCSLVSSRQGLGELARTDADRNFCRPRVCALGVDGAGRFQGAQRVFGLGQVGLGPGDQEQQFQPRGIGQPRRGETCVFQQRLALALRQHGLRQRHHDLGPVDAQLLCFVQCHFGRSHLAIGNQSPAEQHMHGQHAGVVLDRVLQLDDGALVILLLETDQRVFVELRCARVGGECACCADQNQRCRGDGPQAATALAREMDAVVFFHGGRMLEVAGARGRATCHALDRSRADLRNVPRNRVLPAACD